MKDVIKILSIIALISVIGLNSCKKDKDEEEGAITVTQTQWSFFHHMKSAG